LGLADINWVEGGKNTCFIVFLTGKTIKKNGESNLALLATGETGKTNFVLDSH